MFILSAFADEISPDPQTQIDVLKSCGVRHIEFRSIVGTNVLALSDMQIREFQSLLEANRFGLSAIGSPIGKIGVDEAFEPHLERFRRAIELCGVFGTPLIRVFSYYKPEGTTWEQWRPEVMRRMLVKAEMADKAGVQLVHENEHGIYGDSPERVRDLLDTVTAQVGTRTFAGVYDPANYVFCGYDPWRGWELTRDYTRHFHIKDWVAGQVHGCPAGQGQGRIAEVMAEATARGYHGFATLEPHLRGGGPTGGVTGPDLFPGAVRAFQDILDEAGAKYQ